MPSSSWTGPCRSAAGPRPPSARPGRRPAPAAPPARRWGRSWPRPPADPGVGQQPAQLGLVDRADRVASRRESATRVARRRLLVGGRTSPARRSPTSPPRRSANRVQPDTPPAPTGSRLPGPCRRPRSTRTTRSRFLPGRSGSIRTGRTPVGQVDGDRAAEDAGPDDHHRPVVVAAHRSPLPGGRRAGAHRPRVWPPPRFSAWGFRLPPRAAVRPYRSLRAWITLEVTRNRGRVAGARRLPWDAAYEMS